jgi:hypothetical protein
MASPCPDGLPHTLAYGSQGDEVHQIQVFLTYEKLLAPLYTGFFGRLTEAAVKKWQTMHGIITSGSPGTTGYGVAGPKTRAAIMRSCTKAIPADMEGP